MARRSSISPPWLVAILVAALACSAVVVWALVRITGGTGNDAGTESSGAPPPVTGATPVGTTIVLSDPSGAPTSTSPASPGSTRSPAAATTSTAPPLILTGSGVSVPAAWSGTAELTITVNGECAATGGTSTYSGLTADLALQPPVAGTGPFGDPNPLSMTLGVTPAAIPGLALYSAAADGNGAVRRTWWLATGPDPEAGDRTLLSGALIADRPIDGDLPPNLLVDSETDLLPCQSGRPSGVSRTLGTGSSLTGWVSPTAAVLDVTGSTTDGERTIRLHADLQRLPAGP